MLSMNSPMPANAPTLPWLTERDVDADSSTAAGPAVYANDDTTDLLVAVSVLP
jgi:hypothetical protein